MYGGCLCCCNGRGKNLFGASDHDAVWYSIALARSASAASFATARSDPWARAIISTATPLRWRFGRRQTHERTGRPLHV